MPHIDRSINNGGRLRSTLASAVATFAAGGWRLLLPRFANVAANILSNYSDAQYYGLEVLYNATDGEQWTQSNGWRNSTLSVCKWHGVTCDADSGNVTMLSLADNGLSGNLTAEAGELDWFFGITSLTDIDMSSNRLVGPVPAGLGMMPALKSLDLSRNLLSSFPEAWGSNATSLEHLSLQFNNISG